MHRYPSMLAAGLLLAALAPSPARAENTWNNADGDFFWNAASFNWTLPEAWLDGDDAVFGPVGVGAITVASPIVAHDITFSSPGYTITAGASANTITLVGSTPTLTAREDVTIAASILGTSGLTINGPGVVTLKGDVTSPNGNHYTGGTYIKGGTVILQVAGAADGSAPGGSHAVDSIEALDTGATLKLGTTFNPGNPLASQWVSAPSHEQVGANMPGTKFVMTGGVFDLNNDPKNQRIRCPEGFGLIINNGSSVQSGLNVVMDGLSHTFSGVIADGNNGVLTGDNFANGATPQGPGYQIGIVSISGTAGSTWTLAGDNTYSGSTRIDGNTIVKLAGNHSLGTPTLTGSLTGPLRIQGGSALDMNGRNQTIALTTDGGGTSAKIYNSAVGTVSTLTVGYGNEQASRSIATALMDNTGVGGIFAFKKINTQPYALIQSNVTTSAVTSNWVTSCTQGLKAACVATYSGDTTVEGGLLDVQGPSAISPNSAYRLNTTTANYGPGVLKLSFNGNATCRQLWIDGVQQPNGVYGAGTPGIDPASTGTITVTGFAPVILTAVQSGDSLNFSWAGVYKLQSSPSLDPAVWTDVPGAVISPVAIPMDSASPAKFYRLATLP